MYVCSSSSTRPNILLNIDNGCLKNRKVKIKHIRQAITTVFFLCYLFFQMWQDGVARPMTAVRAAGYTSSLTRGEFKGGSSKHFLWHPFWWFALATYALIWFTTWLGFGWWFCSFSFDFFLFLFRFIFWIKIQWWMASLPMFTRCHTWHTQTQISVSDHAGRMLI